MKVIEKREYSFDNEDLKLLKKKNTARQSM